MLECGIVRLSLDFPMSRDVTCVDCFDLVVRTGQAHRTLVGHTGPVTCVQFDEYHLVSGSLDKSVRVSLLYHHIFTTSKSKICFDLAGMGSQDWSNLGHYPI